MPAQQNITPYLWFDGTSHAAVNFYVETFKDARLVSTIPGPGGDPIGAKFEIGGRGFGAINGGLMFKFSEAIPVFIGRETQDEVARLCDRLTSDGGALGHCGWLKDKYRLSWQVVPRCLLEYFADPDLEKCGRVVQAMMGMSKLDIAALHAAAAGG